MGSQLEMSVRQLRGLCQWNKMVRSKKVLKTVEKLSMDKWVLLKYHVILDPKKKKIQDLDLSKFGYINLSL